MGPSGAEGQDQDSSSGYVTSGLGVQGKTGNVGQQSLIIVLKSLCHFLRAWRSPLSWQTAGSIPSTMSVIVRTDILDSIPLLNYLQVRAETQLCRCSGVACSARLSALEHLPSPATSASPPSIRPLHIARTKTRCSWSWPPSHSCSSSDPEPYKTYRHTMAPRRNMQALLVPKSLLHTAQCLLQTCSCLYHVAMTCRKHKLPR